jgi:hypothetical protein
VLAAFGLEAVRGGGAVPVFAAAAWPGGTK